MAFAWDGHSHHKVPSPWPLSMPTLRRTVGSPHRPRRYVLHPNDPFCAWRRRIFLSQCNRGRRRPGLETFAFGAKKRSFHKKKEKAHALRKEEAQPELTGVRAARLVCAHGPVCFRGGCGACCVLHQVLFFWLSRWTSACWKDAREDTGQEWKDAAGCTDVRRRLSIHDPRCCRGCGER